MLQAYLIYFAFFCCLFLLEPTNYVQGLKCYDCSGRDNCAKLISHGWSGSCEIEEKEGKCFIREDSNGISYRGCADDAIWPQLNYSYSGCRQQQYLWFDHKPVLWCFCDGDYCNTNISEVSRVYGAPPPSSSSSASQQQQGTSGTSIYVEVHRNGQGRSDDAQGRSAQGQGYAAGSSQQQTSNRNSGFTSLNTQQYAKSGGSSSSSSFNSNSLQSGMAGQDQGYGGYSNSGNTLSSASGQGGLLSGSGSKGKIYIRVPVTNQWQSSIRPGEYVATKAGYLPRDRFRPISGREASNNDNDANSRSMRYVPSDIGYGSTVQEDYSSESENNENNNNDGNGNNNNGNNGKNGNGNGGTNGNSYNNGGYNENGGKNGNGENNGNGGNNGGKNGNGVNNGNNGNGVNNGNNGNGENNGNNGNGENNGNNGNGVNNGNGGNNGGKNGNVKGNGGSQNGSKGNNNGKGNNGKGNNGKGNTKESDSDFLQNSFNEGGLVPVKILPPTTSTTKTTLKTTTTVPTTTTRTTSTTSTQLTSTATQTTSTASSQQQSTTTTTSACAVANGGCQQTCSVTSSGDVSCSCRSGFELDTDQSSCRDVNECLRSNGGCSQSCNNALGSYECTCDDGYILNVDGRTCDDVDECSVNNGGCQQDCVNIIGSFRCSCRLGFRLDSTTQNCTDVNECQTNNGGCEQNCTNTAGSFTCSCTGDLYQLGSDSKSCMGKCPSDFRENLAIGSCYKVFSRDDDARTNPASEAHCNRQHPEAHLVSIETDDEQTYLASLLRQELEALTFQGKDMLEGWQGWWTSAQFRPGVNQFQWATGTYINANSKYWGFKGATLEGTCVWVMQISFYNFTWGNYDCNTLSGHICEIRLPEPS